MRKTYRLAYFVSHPIQYQAPLLKKLNDEQDIDLHVFFLTDISTKEYNDSGFNQKVEWDTPLLEGYRYTFLESELKLGDFSLNNPNVSLSSCKSAVLSQNWDAIWIHGYANKALLYIIYLCRKYTIPLLFRGESNLISTSKHFLKTYFIRSLVKQSSALLSIGSENSDYYRYFGAEPNKIFSVPYTVDNDRFQQKPSKPSSNSVSKVQNKLVILYASKFIPRKHPILLIEAFNMLPDELKDKAELWFIGNGEQKELMASLITKYQLQASVKLLGFKNQSELPWYFCQCDVFVLPSEKEPFGLIINEVMNQAKAIITTNEVGAARDLVDHDNGWVIKAGSQIALSNALKEALQNPKKLKEMGQKSLLKISKWNYQQDMKGIREALQFVSKH